jgi:serine/threonine-protein kinase
VLFTVIRRGFSWDKVSTAVRGSAVGERKELVPKAADARYLESGHLVYARDGVLLAQTFDAKRFEMSGAPVAVLDDVMHAVGATSGTLDTGAAQVAISSSGTLAYVRGGPHLPFERRLVWIDARGGESPVGVAPGPHLAPRLSPDGRRIAVMLHPSRNQDVWVHEPAGGASSRRTFGGSNAFPIWTPDGRRLTISRSLEGPAHLFWTMSVGGQHEPEVLMPRQHGVPADWTTDGRTLVFVKDMADEPWDIWALTREQTTWRATPVVRSRFSDIEPALSPDGRWLAYVSDESGQPQVFVQPFPGPGARHHISIDSGREPLWARDGKTLYYLAPNPSSRGGHIVMAVPITSGATVTPGKPKPLFPTSYGGTTPVRGYDIAPDGRFLMVRSQPVPSSVVTHLDVIQNWSTDLLQRVPAKARGSQ